ncbi:MAG: type II secretion system protein [Sedimentisphaerales bacterium]|nr:type II secretion system protein [Sedimentisphaerales bacterium]
MTTSVDRKITARSSQTGFTLIETVVSMLIVGTMLVAAMSTVGASRYTQFKTSCDNRGRLLAELLMAEILRQEYQEPDGTATFGRETGETGATRESFDDVDDYHSWSSSPPTNKDGMAISSLDGWQRSVTVVWVDPLNVAQAQSTETNAKRITVTATHDNIPVATLVAIKTTAGL